MDLDKASLHVRATLTRVGVERGDRNPAWTPTTTRKTPKYAQPDWKLTKPKTPNSRRTVPLPDVTVQELRRWKVQQERERLAAGSRWQDHGFVFTNRHGGPLNLSNLARWCFRRVMERAGLGEYGPEVPAKAKGRPGPSRQRSFTPSHRMYALRYSFASLAVADGVPLLTVSRLMGHTSIKLTADVYSKFLPKQREEAAAHLNRLFPLLRIA